MITSDIIIAGNWKMNKTLQESRLFMEKFLPLTKNLKIKVILFVPFVCLDTCIKLSEGSNVLIGAQNFHWEESGSYTGEISLKMLESMGVKNVMLGHSERRLYFGETDTVINKKLKLSQKYSFNTILCVGETKEQRDKNLARESIKMQIKNALYGVDASILEKIHIAYEPIWAIGTKKIPNLEEIEDMCRVIKDTFCEVYGKNLGITPNILYGGSVDDKNCEEILKLSDVDGALVGGASLDVEIFHSILSIADNINSERIG